MIETNKPLVSVIIATYRREKSLFEAISSLTVQTYKNIEIIVIDDNADKEWNDKVNNVVNNFLEDKRIVYIKNENNEGSAQTRNIAAKTAKGEYITFLDDDDVYLPKKIENQLKYMIETNADYSITDLMLYNEKNEIEEIRKRVFIKNVDKNSLLEYHLKYHLTGTDTLMFKKDYLKKINYFDKIDIGDEFYLMLKAINNNGVFAYVPLCDVKAYIHTGDGGLSSGNGKIKGENELYEYKKQYFNNLKKDTIRYIKMRHHAVLAFAYLRIKKYDKLIMESLKAFYYSPIKCIELVLNRK